MRTNIGNLKDTMPDVIEDRLDECARHIWKGDDKSLELYQSNRQRFAYAVRRFLEKNHFTLHGSKTKLIGGDLGIIVDVHFKKEKKLQRLFIKLEAIKDEVMATAKQKEATAFKLLGKKTAVEQKQANIDGINVSCTREFAEGSMDLAQAIYSKIEGKINDIMEDYEAEYKAIDKKYSQELEDVKKELEEIEREHNYLLEPKLFERVKYLRDRRFELMFKKYDLAENDKKELRNKKDIEIAKLYADQIKETIKNESLRIDLFNIANKSLFLGLLDIRGQNIVLDAELKSARVVDIQTPEFRPDFEEFDYYIDKLEVKELEKLERFDRTFFNKEEGIAKFVIDLFAVSESGKYSTSILGSGIFNEGSKAYLYEALIESLKTPNGQNEFFTSLKNTINELLEAAKSIEAEGMQKNEMLAALNRIIKINNIVKANFNQTPLIEESMLKAINDAISSLENPELPVIKKSSSLGSDRLPQLSDKKVRSTKSFDSIESTLHRLSQPKTVVSRVAASRVAPTSVHTAKGLSIVRPIILTSGSSEVSSDSKSSTPVHSAKGSFVGHALPRMESAKFTDRVTRKPTVVPQTLKGLDSVARLERMRVLAPLPCIVK